MTAPSWPRIRRGRLPGRGLLVAGLLVAAAGALARGAWIPVKAEVAQVLLDRAWERARGGEAEARPWSWADLWPVARLEAPRQGVHEIVVAGAHGSALAFAPGHLAGTPAPGERGNAVVAGHRDTHFAFLRDLAPGDALVVETPTGRRVPYRVTETVVTDRTDARWLRPTPEDRLTLVTCWPFDAVRPGGPGRYVVVAEAVRGAPVRRSRTPARG